MAIAFDRELEARLDKALHKRDVLVQRLLAEGTDAYRLFNGAADGIAGLTLDRYGPLALAQTFREPLELAAVEALESFCARTLGLELFAWNHRGADPVDAPPPRAAALEEVVCRERHVRFAIRARHRGLDPWLFLDLRAARRRLAELAQGKSVVNYFAYTCGAGIAAAAAGASEVWNVDFARSSLDVGRRNAELNDLSLERVRFVQEDFFPVALQLASLEVKGRGRFREYQLFDARRFDLVFLDPPAWSKGPFGAVDVEHDYPSLAKPALLALAEGGTLVATNHVARVEAAAWRDVLERCARKAGVEIDEVEMLEPDRDFPSFDGRPPLKIAVVRRQ